MRAGYVTKVKGVPTKNYGIFLYTVIAVIIGALPCQAAPITLGDLLAGGSITQGDKLFNHFTATNFEDASTIPVVGITTATGEQGFRISGSTSVVPGEISVSSIDYQVHVLDANFLIHDVTVSGTASAFTGTGTFSGGVTFTPASISVGVTLSALVLSSSMHSNLLSDVATLFVHTTFTEVGPESIPIITFDQTFSQVPVTTPEPSTWLLLGSGLVGLAAWRRKKAA